MSDYKMMSITTARRKRRRGALAAVALVFIAWIFAGAPASIAEMRFYYRLGSQSRSPDSEMHLAKLMEGDWETACDSNGYYGDLYLAKYGRSYPAAGEMQDGSWGILFINSDGTYTSAAGNCLTTGVRVNLPGCMARDVAIVRAVATPSGTCTYFR